MASRYSLRGTRSRGETGSRIETARVIDRRRCGIGKEREKKKERRGEKEEEIRHCQSRDKRKKELAGESCSARFIANHALPQVIRNSNGIPYQTKSNLWILLPTRILHSVFVLKKEIK